MGGFELIFGIVPVVAIVIFVMATSVRILRDYERAVIFRLGRRANAVVNPGGDGSGPGLVLLIPFIDKMVRVSLRTIIPADHAGGGFGAQHHDLFPVAHRLVRPAAQGPRYAASIQELTGPAFRLSVRVTVEQLAV